MDAGTHRVQLRVPFSAPSAPVRIHLKLSGMLVIGEVVDGRTDIAGQYLATAGVPVNPVPGHGVSFPAVKMARLRGLPDTVTITCDETLRALWLLVDRPAEDGLPVTVATNAFDELEMSWHDGVCSYDEILPDAAAAVLVHADIPFVATSHAWERLTSLTNAKPLTGLLRASLDGYIEVESSRPQLVESAPVPVLFKLSDRQFGIPLPFVDAVDDLEGFRWDGQRPVPERPPSKLPPMPIELAGHVRSDLFALVAQLTAYRAQVIRWDKGLGRRIMALAAVEALDAWPALVVAPPSNLWAWIRHADLLGRSVALTHQRADLHLVTYYDLPHRTSLESPQAVLIDSPFEPGVVEADARAGLRRLDALLGCYRMAITSSWPDALDEQLALMSALRPGEFTAGVPVPARYPGDSAVRAQRHIDAYLSQRHEGQYDTDDVSSFPRSSVATVAITDAQTRELGRLRTRADRVHSSELLAEAMELVTAGPASSISPKIAAAAARVRTAVEEGKRVAVVTRHRRAATLLTASLRGVGKVTTASVYAEDALPETQVVVVRFDRKLPDLRNFDMAVVLDMPWSVDVLDRAVGAASSSDGCPHVVVLHAAGTVDDRIALLAARRREIAAVSDDTAAPSARERSYLLRTIADQTDLDG